jgi:hypothetical protein
MPSPAKRPTTSWGAIRQFVALTMFVVFSMDSDHAGYAAQFDSQAHATLAAVLVAHHCPDERCAAHQDGQVGCCALGHCGVPITRA